MGIGAHYQEDEDYQCCECTLSSRKSFTIIKTCQVYNASNNELVRTNTLVKSAIIQVDATPFRQWYESHVSI